ncbi:MarR family protein [Pseudonocardia sediminis]|uniref:MarR family protein n=1 Tax=Pseudonocardia sediminis TaxID=1397368 RepID=A0A4Q7USU2_PSEST|nr:MarR family transcriptional regulator [Pseudonocardia sediminis]RZT84054.1 MarR family protein [Pseudonocardia sediminis]
MTNAAAGDDPTLESALRPLKELLDGLDGEISRLYEREGVTGVRPRFTIALIRLRHRGPMTVKALAAEIDVTHSAMSQTVTAMRGEGLVATTPGPDARTRQVELTAEGLALVPFLEAEWRATEQAFAELQAELPSSLQTWIDAMTVALARRRFLDRITEKLDQPGT